VHVVKVPIKAIRRDFQPPEHYPLNDETVAEITSALRRGETLPPVVVRFDGENYWLQDGFHRVEAVLSLGREEIEAEVRPGTLADIEAEFKQVVREHRGKW
jgi:ParB-like chromosome segregation protein Spo0J